MEVGWAGIRVTCRRRERRGRIPRWIRYRPIRFRSGRSRRVSKHTAEPAPPISPVELIELNGTCQKCGDWRQLRDELCVECHPGVGGADVIPAGSIAPGHSADGVSIRTLRNEIEDGRDQHRRPAPRRRQRAQNSSAPWLGGNVLLVRPMESNMPDRCRRIRARTPGRRWGIEPLPRPSTGIGSDVYVSDSRRSVSAVRCGGDDI